MRYIITPSQLHKLVYSYLNDIFSNEDFRRETNEFVEDGNTWRITMFDKNGKEQLVYFWFGPGTYDDDTPHNGIGNLHVHPNIADFIRKTFSIREGRAVDIVADWVSEKFGVDIDEISVYPNREKPVNY